MTIQTINKENTTPNLPPSTPTSPSSPCKTTAENIQALAPSPASFTQSATLPLNSPTKKRKIEANPSTPTVDRVTKHTPSKPIGPALSSPEASRKFGKITSPNADHNPHTFNKSDRKPNKTVRRLIDRLGTKPVHTFEMTSPLKKRPKHKKPDADGRIEDNSRFYHLHASPNPSNNNKLIPESGRNLIRMSGAMAAELHTHYSQNGIQETFETYLERECTVRAALSPDKEQNLKTTGLDFLTQ